MTSGFLWFAVHSSIAISGKSLIINGIIKSLIKSIKRQSGSREDPFCKVIAPLCILAPRKRAHIRERESLISKVYRGSR